MKENKIIVKGGQAQNRKLNLLNPFIVYGFCFLLAFVCLFICCPNSPIYVFNDTCDTNWFIVMGKGVLNGLVPYKDLFEQKGPLFYLVFAVCCLFKNVNFGIFLLEVICSSLFLFFSFKILKHYLNNYSSFIGVMLVALLTYTSSYKTINGGAVEEYCLPILAYILYLFIVYLDNKKPLTIFQNLLVGAGLAFIFWSKYTILAFPACLLIAYFVISLVRKEYKTITCSILLMLVGFVAISVIPITYLAANHALKDMVYDYFYINIFAYNSQTRFWLSFARFFYMGLAVSAVTIIGFILLLKNKSAKYRWLLFCLFLINFSIVVFQKSIVYYFIQLIPYSVLGLAQILQKFKPVKFKKLIAVAVLFVTIINCTFLCYTTEQIFYKKEDYPQFVVANQINKIAQERGIENPTLFAYRMLSCSFYNAANIMPNVKYYANNVISEQAFPQMYEEFKNTIKTQKADFVITLKEFFIKDQELLTSYYTHYGEYSYYQSETFRNVKQEFVLLVKNFE